MTEITIRHYRGDYLMVLESHELMRGGWLICRDWSRSRLDPPAVVERR